MGHSFERFFGAPPFGGLAQISVPQYEGLVNKCASTALADCVGIFCKFVSRFYLMILHGCVSPQAPQCAASAPQLGFEQLSIKTIRTM